MSRKTKHGDAWISPQRKTVYNGVAAAVLSSLLINGSWAAMDGVTSNPEDEIFASAIVVPFQSFLPQGQSLVTDGSVEYGALIASAKAQLNAEYQLDGVKRQLSFPAGTFKPGAVAISGYSGVGIKGAGSALTKFVITKTFILTNPAYGSTTWHENQLFSGFEVDCSQQVVESGYTWYQYKAFFMARCRLQYYKDIVAHDSQGTLFGLDFMDRCYFYDCVAYGSGRATSGQSGPGAGFGISIGHEEVEVCEFHRCQAYNNKTGGFYFEAVGGATTKPTGVLVKDCISYGNYIGVDDCGCGSILVQGGAHYNNAFAGVKWGANAVSSYNKGPINGRIVGSDIYGNGAISSSNPTTGGVVFTYSVNTAGSVFRITDTDIHDNVVSGVTNQFITSVSANGQLPSGLVIDGTSKIRSNGGSGLYFYHPTQVLTGLEVDDTVIVENNGTSNSVEIADGITLCCNSDGVNIACIGRDTLAAHRQQSVVAFRGPQFVANDPTITGDFTGHETISPIRMEHAVTGVFTNTAMLNPGRPTEVLAVNAMKDPSAAGAFNPTISGGALSESTVSTAPSGSTTSWIGTASGTSTLSLDFFSNVRYGVLDVGDSYCLSAWVKCSVAGKTLSTNANINQTAVGVVMVPAIVTTGEWQRVMFFGRLKSETFTANIRLSSPGAGVTLEVTDVMMTEGSNLYDFFDGDTNGGAWAGTANNSQSTKTIAA